VSKTSIKHVNNFFFFFFFFKRAGGAPWRAGPVRKTPWLEPCLLGLALDDVVRQGCRNPTMLVKLTNTDPTHLVTPTLACLDCFEKNDKNLKLHIDLLLVFHGFLKRTTSDFFNLSHLHVKEHTCTGTQLSSDTIDR
jgi:hypothetical protein